MLKNMYISIDVVNVVISVPRHMRINIHKQYKTEVEAIRKAIYSIMHECEVSNNIGILNSYHIKNVSDTLTICMVNRATDIPIRLAVGQSTPLINVCLWNTDNGVVSVHMDGTLINDIISFWMAGVIDIVHNSGAGT